ncbi:unnamed protein product [Dibothriocephalus latus]|uniref:Uncharacterized protein n=1 Tax=Dibothriocephalus latus TaxID=60516 RepID=A0A3P7LF82_DIBLA|nr:unnamed protein product [Dibothriocephalus latus]
MTGTDPKGYNDTVRDYEAAMDEFEIVSMYNARNASHPEIKKSEPPSTVMRTAYPLPMGTLSRISVGSLQNLNLLGGNTKKEAADSAVPCRHSSFKDRAGSAPRERLPPRNSAHGRTSAGLRSSHGLDQRPSLRKWFSLKGLNGSMTVPSSSRKEAYSPKMSVCRRIYSDTVSPAEKPELNLSELDDLIAWKEVEAKTVENILAENRSLSTDRSRSRKARLAYNSSAEENAAKEVAELKAKRGFALAVKTKTDMNAKATEAPVAKTSCVSSVCDDADTFVVRRRLPKQSEDLTRPCIGINMEKYTPVTPRPSEPSFGVVVSDARPQASRTNDHLTKLSYHGNNGNHATNEAKGKNISTFEQLRTVKNQSPIPRYVDWHITRVVYSLPFLHTKWFTCFVSNNGGLLSRRIITLHF